MIAAFPTDTITIDTLVRSKWFSGWAIIILECFQTMIKWSIGRYDGNTSLHPYCACNEFLHRPEGDLHYDMVTLQFKI